MTRILLLLSIFLFDTDTTRIDGLSSPQNTFREVQYLMRTVDASTIGPANESLIIECYWTRRGMEQVYTAKFKIIRTFPLRYMLVRFERCRDLEIGCEDFQTWNVTPLLFCEVVKMKNQLWSPFVEHITPRTLFQNCPELRLKQGIYTMENVTFRTDVVVKFYNEAIKYYWKVYGMYYNLKNEIEIRTFFRSYFVKYIKRDRIN